MKQFGEKGLFGEKFCYTGLHLMDVHILVVTAFVQTFQQGYMSEPACNNITGKTSSGSKE